MKSQEVIKELTQKHGLTQTAIAKEIGCKPHTVSRYAYGRKIMLKYAVPLVKLARKKGIKVKIEDFAE